MREYAFDFDPSALHRGRVIFKMVNDGRLVHRMILVPWPEGYPPIDVQLTGQDRRIVQQAVAIRNLEPAGPGQQHGMTESFAFDLAPGRYAFLCLYADPDGVSHANKGMVREFQIP